MIKSLLGVGAGMVVVTISFIFLFIIYAVIAGGVFTGLLLFIDYICGTSLFSWKFVGIFIAVFVTIKILIGLTIERKR